MRLKNTTDIPDALVREVIRFVKPPGCGGVTVKLKNSQSDYAGSAWGRRLVIVRIGGAKRFPVRRAARDGYLSFWVFNRIEALVAVMAHELRHVWQAYHPRGWRVWGARGQFSERDADAYALRTLRAWRRHGSRQNVCRPITVRDLRPLAQRGVPKALVFS